MRRLGCGSMHDVTLEHRLCLSKLASQNGMSRWTEHGVKLASGTRRGSRLVDDTLRIKYHHHDLFFHDHRP